MSQSTVLIVEDDQPLKEALISTLESVGYGVLAAADGSEALTIVDDSPVDLVVSDIQMQPMGGAELLVQLGQQHPDIPVLLMTAYGTIEQAVDAMRDGAADYLVKPFDADLLRERVARHLKKNVSDDGLIVVDPRSHVVMAMASKAAESDVTVLLTGESGTGKEIVARFIHRHSPRKDGPFVAINCAAIPEQMLEALLFGYEKGAFTGAVSSKEGKFVQTNGGTLLLDEITEMDLNLQAKLLRVLQEKEVEPLGARRTVALDVRVLATSNRNLQAAVEDGEFREDLYYRLNVFPLELPPLRDRPGDIEKLAQAFIQTAWTKAGPPPQLSDRALQSLQNSRWPGNIRQLQNVIQRALVLATGPTLMPEHLSIDPVQAPVNSSGNLSSNLWAEESRRILEVLEASNGRRKLAAEQLGISPRTLRYKLAKIRESGSLVPSGASA